MKYIYSIKIIFLIIFIFTFTACTPSHLPENKGGFYHSGIYFGSHFPNIYKKGIRDGCTTSKGTYNKSHSLFQNNKDYEDGWFLGRNRCKDLLVIDEE
ncbi:MAG: hypothetical protein COA92_04750 [Sulfurovum sp.]|nr:MAG: hypothetical protein COA92_04750 [Sulfurovum sp.]